MKYRLHLMLCLALLTAAVAAPVAAQDWKGRGRAQGVVTDEAGEPIEGAQIRLYTGFGENQEGPEPIFTNAKGKWSLLGLKLGAWSVEITKEGYDVSSGSFAVQTQRSDTIRTTLYAQVLEEVVDEKAVAAKASLEEGNVLLAEGRFDEARAAYRSAMDGLDVQYHGMILMEIARTYSLADDSNGAIDTLKELLAAEPENETAIRLIADLLVAEGRMEEAQPYIALLPEDAKLDPAALANIGIDLYNSNDFEGAITQFDLILGDQSDYAKGYYYRGLSHIALAHNAEAMADFKRFLELAPEDPASGEIQQMLEYLESQE